MALRIYSRNLQKNKGNRLYYCQPNYVRIYLRTKNIMKDKKVSYMIKTGSVIKKIQILNIYAPNNSTLKYMKQKLKAAGNNRQT